MLTDADRRALSLLFWTHVNPLGRFELDINSPSTSPPQRPDCPVSYSARYAGFRTGGEGAARAS